MPKEKSKMGLRLSRYFLTHILGIHLCIDCAGKHRQFGVMYSFVKSTNLDSWNRRQLTYMQKGGNNYHNLRKHKSSRLLQEVRYNYTN
jgi:hypothetical protein